MRSNASSTRQGFVASALLTIAVIGGIAYYIVSQSINNQRKNLLTRIDHEIDVLTNRVFSLLADPHKCRVTFESTLSPKEIASKVNFDALTSAFSKTQSDLKTLDNGGKLYGDPPKLPISITNYEVLDAPDMAKLHIYFRNDNKAAKSSFHRQINLYIEWEGAPFSSRLVNCRAVTDTDQIWSVEEGTAIYYIGDATNSGKAAVGKGENSAGNPVPLTSTFEVVGAVKVGPAADAASPLQSGRVMSAKYLYPSDRRLKKNIQDISQPLRLATGLHGVSFRWSRDGRSDYGFIAQELQATFPEVVREDPDSGLLAVDYARLTGVLVEAVKAQQKQLNALRSEVSRLRR